MSGWCRTIPFGEVDVSMSKTQLNLQDIFLNQVRKESISVTIYLIGGVQLRGVVRGLDAFTILLDSTGRPTQLVYKHAVTSIVPSRPVSNFYADAHRDPQGQVHNRPQPPPSAAEPTSED
jgi:host factor-I protein